MATSSIFINIIIKDEKSAKAIVNAFEEFEANGSPRHEIKSRTVTDSGEIKKIASMWGAKKKNIIISEEIVGLRTSTLS